MLEQNRIDKGGFLQQENMRSMTSLVVKQVKIGAGKVDYF